MLNTARHSHRRKIGEILRAEDGATAVEFALVVPVFLMVLIAIIVYGVYFAGLIAVTNAASEGARASVSGLSNTERQTLASTAASNAFASYAPFLDSSNMTVASQASTSDNRLFQVSVSYDFSKFGFAGLSGIIPVPVQKPTVTIMVAAAGSF